MVRTNPLKMFVLRAYRIAVVGVWFLVCLFFAPIEHIYCPLGWRRYLRAVLIGLLVGFACGVMLIAYAYACHSVWPGKLGVGVVCPYGTSQPVDG